MMNFRRLLFGCAILFAIAGCIVIGITIGQFDRELPDYQQLGHYQPAIMTRIHAGDGRLLAEFAPLRRLFVRDRVARLQHHELVVAAYEVTNDT